MHFGIDLGTTNALIAVFRDGAAELIPHALGSVMTPSVVAFRDKRLLVGQAAKEVAQAQPAMAASLFKRAMGTERRYNLNGQAYGAAELSAMVLATLKADAEAHLGVTVSDVVISVPAYFNELQRKAVRTAGQIAGLNVTRLINEPTAAALAYGLHDREADGAILVFDLGGGTFDVSILDLFEGVMEVRASAGDAFLGGEDFTEVLAGAIASQSGMDVHDTALRPALLALAERAKHGLSNAASVEVQATIQGFTIAQTLTRDAFDAITAPLMARISAPLDRALKDANITPEKIGKVVLVGGATRMPAVRSYAGRKLRQFPVMGLDPDHVVALGAAVQAALVARDAALDDVVMTDVSAFTLGVESAHQAGQSFRTGYFTPMIERNSIIPTSHEQSFTVIEKGQQDLRFAIYQGESPLVANNLFLGEVMVKVPHNLNEYERATVRFTYDVSGLLEVDVTVTATGARANLVIDQLAGDMSQDEIATALARMKRLKIHPRQEAANIHLRTRLEAVYAIARGAARDWVTQLLLRFDVAVDSQNPTTLAALRTEIHADLDAFEAQHVT